MKRAWITAAVIGTAALCAPAAASAAGGLADATATPGTASGAAIDLPGVLTLNKSTATSNGSNVQQVTLLGVNVLGKQAGQNTGALAPVGGVVDTLNGALCKSGPSATAPCLVVLYSNQTDKTQTIPGIGTQQNHAASATTLALSGGGVGLSVLGSQAASNQQTPTGGTSTCTNLSRGYILVATAPGLPNDGVKGLDNTAAVLNQPC
jgi:hypothetical protein